MDKLICPVVLNMDLTLPDHAEVNRDASVVDSAEDDHVTCVRTMVMYWLSERVKTCPIWTPFLHPKYLRRIMYRGTNCLCALTGHFY